MDSPTVLKQSRESRRAFRAYRKQVEQLDKLAEVLGKSKAEICEKLGIPMPEPPVLKLTGNTVSIPIDMDC